tara:strand:- start:151 stop:672 length:522 start_codon:yes stop_codon:yes gene_type:complete
MAEEDADDILEGDPPKRRNLIIILIIIFLLAALGGGGYYAYTNFFQKPPEEVEKVSEEERTGEEEKEPEETLALGVMVSMEPFIVNLARSKGKRFLKVSITLELSSPEVNVEINENIQKITDSILILLSSKTFEDVYSVQGKFKLKDEVTTRVNRFLVLGHVKDAYFTEFVIQ